MIAWTGVIWSGVAGYRRDDERGESLAGCAEVAGHVRV